MKKTKDTRTQYAADTEAIPLSRELFERLQQAAEWKEIGLEQAAQQAITEYVGQFGREKIAKENEAFEAMHAELLAKYRGQYVAIHNGQVVEHAPDLRSLHAKVFARFGYTPILHRQVTDEPEPDVIIRSPRLECP